MDLLLALILVFIVLAVFGGYRAYRGLGYDLLYLFLAVLLVLIVLRALRLI